VLLTVRDGTKSVLGVSIGGKSVASDCDLFRSQRREVCPLNVHYARADRPLATGTVRTSELEFKEAKSNFDRESADGLQLATPGRLVHRLQRCCQFSALGKASRGLLQRCNRAGGGQRADTKAKRCWREDYAQVSPMRAYAVAHVAQRRALLLARCQPSGFRWRLRAAIASCRPKGF
jgi:hypothetical protein